MKVNADDSLDLSLWYEIESMDAIRRDGRGGYSASLLLQYNFGKLTSASDRAFENLQNTPRLPFRFSQ